MPSDDLKKLADEIIQMKSVTNRLTPLAHLQPGTMAGTIVSVNDPLDRGRVKVVTDNFNPNDSGQTSSYQATTTAWATVTNSFIGKQSEMLVGQRVFLHTVGNDPNNLVVGDVIHDDNSVSPALGNTMVRMPMYSAGNLPKPCAANLGCTVIELDGPCSSDWLCTCLRRRGTYLWIRHVDLNHIHADQDDGRQPPDSAKNTQEPVDEGTIWDKVAPTTDKAYAYQSYDTLDSDWFGGA